MASQIQQMQNSPLIGGYKYATLEEAKEADRLKHREYYHNKIKLNKEGYNAYHREYYQKKKQREEQTKQLQCFIEYQYVLQQKYIQSGYIQQLYLQEVTAEGYNNLQSCRQEILKEAAIVISKLKESPEELLCVKLIILTHLILYSAYPTEDILLQWLIIKNQNNKFLDEIEKMLGLTNQPKEIIITPNFVMEVIL